MLTKERIVNVTLLLVFSLPNAFSQQEEYAFNALVKKSRHHVIVLDVGQKKTEFDLTGRNHAQEDFVGRQKVRIYTNPGKRLNVDVPEFTEEYGLSIYLCNTSGLLLLSKSPAFKSNSIDFSDYPQGTYILKIVLGGQKCEWKIENK